MQVDPSQDGQTGSRIGGWDTALSNLLIETPTQEERQVTLATAPALMAEAAFGFGPVLRTGKGIQRLPGAVLS